jgi:ketosteroid isomerase-like protein
LCSITKAQKSIEGLIDAEKSFAAYSVAHGTKDAFLKFADSAGIVFIQEIEASANAIDVWNKRENRPGKLDWQPEYAEIANSKDFGYTTGPYTFTRNDSVLARGEYVTVWQINKDGEWKFLLDLGVSNTPKILVINLNKISAEKISGNASTDDMVKAEQEFIFSFKIDRKKAYEKYLSGKSILKRNGEYSVTNKKLQKKTIADDPLDTKFKMIGSGIASSGDLGYIYGTITVGVKQFGYQRIWRKEKDGWKIALEVLRY